MWKSISIVGMLCLSLAAAPVAKTVLPVHPTGAHTLVNTLANTHLHGAKPAVEKAIKHDAHSTLARHWHRRWAFAEWASVHRGTGTVMGEVRSKTGSAVAGALVRLKKSNGASFKTASARHTVHTNSSGTFIMHHVRIGSYRVRADKAKANGHVGIHLHGGTTASVNVKI